MFRTIRFRLAAWYTGVITLTVVLFSFVIYVYLFQTLSASLDESLTSEMKWIGSRFEKQATRGETDDAVREDIREHAAFYPIKEYIEIWRPSGAMMYHRNLYDDTLVHYIAIPQDSNVTIQTVKNFRDYEIRLTMQKTSQAFMLLAMPTESVGTPIDHLLRIFIWLGPLLLVIAIGGGTYLANKSFAKVNKVIETAKHITAENLDERIPAHNVRDEIGGLVATFNEMISRLDVSFRHTQQFSADASHELRTPVSVMRTQLEAALSTKVSLSELKTIAANCLDETIRMTSIIENLLLLARADAGKDVISREPVDLDKLVRETYDESVIIASPKGINVTLTQAEPARMLGDEQRLRQMLLNLIDNAIKHNHVNGKI